MRFFRLYLPLLALLLAGFIIRLEGIANTDETSPAGSPLWDDSYYYFSLGHNLAEGNGPKVDSEHNTTGYQPLWGFLVGGVFVLFPEHGIWGTQLLGALVGIMGAAAVYGLTYRVTRAVWAAAINTALWVFAPMLVRDNLSGMETSLAMLAHLLMFYSLYNLYLSRSLYWLICSGITCGLGFLARVDTGILSALIGLTVLLIAPLGSTFGNRIRAGILWGLCALVVVLPWVFFTFAIGKSPVPESGDAVRSLNHFIGETRPPALSVESFMGRDPAYPETHNYYRNNIVWFASTIADQVYLLSAFDDLGISLEKLEILPPFGGAFSVMMMLIVLMIAAGLWQRPAWIFPVLLTLWAFTMIVAYALVVISTWYYARYALPLATILSVFVVMMIARAGTRLNQWVQLILAVGVISYGLIILADYRDLYEHDPEYQWVFQGQPTNDENGYYTAVEWLNTNLPPDTRVGAFQSGLIGYFAEVQIINLDGKVNHEANLAMRDQQMWAYVCEENLAYIVEWPIWVYYLLMLRSPEWDETNLTLVHEIPNAGGNPLQILEVNRENCP